MADETTRRQVLRLFAHLLEYPYGDLAGAAQECQDLISPGQPEAGALLDEFRVFVENASLGRLQEVYTATFDLDATCHPYVGHHLFGESYQRSAFMLGLKERYQVYNLNTGSELPDHLAVMMRYLSACDEAREAQEIIQEALLPALEKMAGKAQADSGQEGPANLPSPAPKPRQAYRVLLEALRLALQSTGNWDRAPVSDHGRTQTDDDQRRSF